MTSLSGSKLGPLDYASQSSFEVGCVLKGAQLAVRSTNPRQYIYTWWQGTRKQKPRLFFETEKQRFLFVFVEAAEGKQEGLWEGSGHSGQGAVGGHAGTRHE